MMALTTAEARSAKFCRWGAGLAGADFHHSNLRTQFEFGRELCHGRGGFSCDEAQAAKWFRTAAERGHARAQHSLGQCYRFGEGVPQDDALAAAWFGAAAEQGLARAQFDLGWCFSKGQGVARDEAWAAELYAKAAEQGDLKAQFNLGLAYLHGRGVQRDRQAAVGWLRKAAMAGMIGAQFRLGCEMASAGEGGSRGVRPAGTGPDDEEALVWLKRAAKQRHAGAMFSIGRIVRRGYHTRGGGHVPPDDHEALDWFRRAAVLGHADAQYTLGVSHEYMLKGVVPLDLPKAVQWYMKAAEQGHARAQYALALCYWYGKGMPRGRRDRERSMNLFSLAANQNHPGAKTWLQRAAGRGGVADVPGGLLSDRRPKSAPAHRAQQSALHTWSAGRAETTAVVPPRAQRRRANVRHPRSQNMSTIGWAKMGGERYRE